MTEPVEKKVGTFPIVGVGASAGGLEALEALFANMPTDIGMSFVVVTHQHPSHTTLLPELLGRKTKLAVVLAEDGMLLETNKVVIAPPGAHSAVLHGKLQFMDVIDAKAMRLPIDYFFRSLADDQEDRAIGVILSGTATDGTLGLKAIKGEAGMAMVQDPTSAKYAGMPSSAIATGIVDYVLSPEKMGEQLAAYANGAKGLVGPITTTETPTLSEQPLQKIFVLLRNRTGNDFASYKSSTIRRRIQRRMNLHQIEEPAQYVRYLEENPHEIDILFKEMLISVTSFFRDPEAFTALAEGPLAELLESRPDGYQFRVWVPGCATGEEAYSLAILIHEAMLKLDKHFEVQIFGTDLDAEAIERARAGRYPGGIAMDLTSEQLERYFIHEDQYYQVSQGIRDMLVFAPQNVIKDPPFTKLDLISCRNLLIYLESNLQQRLLPIFHYALKPGGLLFLGPSETVGNQTDLFSTRDKHWRIFGRIETASTAPALPKMPATQFQREMALTLKTLQTGPQARGKNLTHLAVLVERLLLDQFAPTSVVCNERGEIIYIHGRTGLYLEPATGKARLNLIEMAREGLRGELSSALRQTCAEKREVIRDHVRVRSNGNTAFLRLCLRPIKDPEALFGLFIVTFHPITPPDEEASQLDSVAEQATEPELNERLERELKYAKESLQTTVEQLETSNEELKSTNEELQSTNEELQSTNEELETSKEEMQSLNEELTTVNTELDSKVEDLSQANNDMQNLLNSTEVATLFLDNDLNISRYTDPVKKLIKLIPSDIGRPLGDLSTDLRSQTVAADAAEVLKTLAFKEEEIQTVDGRWYLMRIMPYRTAENAIDGLVITFVNIDRLKNAEKTGAESTAFFKNIVDTVRHPLLILDAELRVVTASQAFYRTFHTSPKQTDGELVYELGSGEWMSDSLKQLLERVLPNTTTVEDFEVDHVFPKIGHRTFMVNARILEQDELLPGLILLGMEDVTQ